MKVLITGGCGFIGSFVAERFYKEGHQIVIIDNLSTGNAEHVQIPHKKYILNVEDPKCEELFKSHHFDIVVHLAAQINVAQSLENPYLDSKTNILGLTNMLQLAGKYKVKKFLFASSAAVYGMNDQTPLTENMPCDPVSPYGINKWMGEYYCRKWKEIYGLETLIFRFSNVYGPRQGTVGEGGVVSIFMERAMNGQELFIYGDGEQTRDFIYVEDLADALCRSVNSPVTGVYNLSTHTETSVNQLVEAFRRHCPVQSVIYRPAREGDIVRSSLDNSRVKRALDWVPVHSLEEGIRKTFEWSREQHTGPNKKAKKKKAPVWKKRLRQLLPYIENGIGFGIVLLLSWKSRHNLYADMLDYKLIYIILMGIMYGTRQSVISIFLSIGLYFSMNLMNGREWISMLYDSETLTQAAVYIFVGAAVGYSMDRKNREVAQKASQITSVAEKYEFLNEVYADTCSVKEELQSQIINSEDSLGKIYNITRELDSLEPEHIFQTAVSVMEKVMRSDEITIYTVNRQSDYVHLVAQSGKPGFETAKSMCLKDSPALAGVVEKKTMYANRTLEPSEPLLIAPVLYKDQVAAVVSVHAMSFEHFTLEYQNRFKVLVLMLTSALTKAWIFTESASFIRYVPGTTVLRTEVFENILELKRQAKNKGKHDFTILVLQNVSPHDSDALDKITGSLRETDYVGQYFDGRLYVILGNSGKWDAEHVVGKMQSIGVRANVVQEEAMYA